MKNIYVVISISHALQVYSIEGVFDETKSLNKYVKARTAQNPGLEFETTTIQVPENNSADAFYVVAENCKVVGVADNQEDVPPDKKSVFLQLNHGRY